MFNKTRLLINKYQKWLYLIIFILLLLFITEKVYHQEMTDFDIKMHELIVINLRSDFLTVIMKFITNFGDTIILFLVTLAILLLIKNKKYGLITFFNLIIIFGLNSGFKMIVRRSRPTGYQLIDQGGYSFPSGHSAISLAFYGLLIYFIWISKLSIKIKRILTIILSILIVLIGFSRIYLGVHYASDVLAGYIFATIYLIIFITIISKFSNKSK